MDALQFIISIRAPAREATRMVEPLTVDEVFQSALPRGKRPKSCKEGDMLTEISIRAPAREATIDGIVNPSRKLFQSALPRGKRLLDRCPGVW